MTPLIILLILFVAGVIDYKNKWGIFRKTENEKYKQWLSLRESSKDERSDKLCYCGHTHKCSCADPDEDIFEQSLKNGNIKLNDENNGWRNAD